MEVFIDKYKILVEYIDSYDLSIVIIDSDTVLNQPYVFHQWGKIESKKELIDIANARIVSFSVVTRKSERVTASYKVVRWDGTLKCGLFNNVKIIEFKENDHITFMDSRVGTLKANMDSIFLVNKLGHLEDIVTLDDLIRLYMPAVDSLAQVDLEEMYR